ncbi:Gx transporter family protein [uncultured Faecalibaculum sp.]|uniref:Gx transporter family protein n=1 Tax=uncultured Faecalibaculum sp. TaxID=1729681 RepID=UPI00272B8437|nr:Gx transporter family protein [uncultured Faecalibaculum sp.]
MKTRRAVILAFLVTAGILLQLLESFVPVVMLVPGYKIGLANIAGLFALYAYGTRDMVSVTVCRIFLAGLLTGTLFSVGFLLSISGAVLALSAMALARKSGLFSIYGVSVAGAAAHSVGQVLAVTAIYQQYFMQMFLPVLLALSIVSGLLIALVTERLLIRMRHVIGRTQPGRN